MDDPGPQAPARKHRSRVLKSATILNGMDKSETVCVIRNMHSEGAELRYAVESRVPDEFLLYVPLDAIAYVCVVKWRHAGSCGVSFMGTAAKPSWHYGR